MKNVQSDHFLTPKKLLLNYLEREGFRNITYNSFSFNFTIFVAITITALALTNDYYSIDFLRLINSFLLDFYLTGFISAIAILTLVITGFAIIGSILNSEFMSATKIIGILDIVYFVVFWDALWAGISSFLWIFTGFLFLSNIKFISIIIGIAAVLSTIYIICITVSLLLTITKLFDFKCDFERTKSEIEKKLKLSK